MAISKTKQFLSDVLITAVEGGIGYWSEVSDYDHGYSDDLSDNTRKPASVVVHEMLEDADDGYKAEGVKVTTTEIAKAFKLIMDRKVEIPFAEDEWRKRMVREYWKKDEADLDAADADAVVQIAMFGKIVYC